MYEEYYNIWKNCEFYTPTGARGCSLTKSEMLIFKKFQKESKFNIWMDISKELALILLKRCSFYSDINLNTLKIKKFKRGFSGWYFFFEYNQIEGNIEEWDE